MTTENKKRFTVITNEELTHNENNERKRYSYQTNPLQEKLVKFTQSQKFTVEDLLKW